MERYRAMATLTVGSHSTYATIAAALAAAQPLDTISLQSGYADESVTVDVNNIAITGQASSKNIDLTLGAGITAITLKGDAPIRVNDNSGNDTITGNSGANIVEVKSGADVVHGGLGIDRLIVDYAATTSSVIGTSSNITDGGTHSVTFDGIENFTITTGSGNDTLTVGDGNNVVSTGIGNDTITTGDGPNTINSGSGDDTVTAGNGHNSILAGTGNDTVTAGNGGNYIDGGVGNDTITSGTGQDVIKAGLGNDTVRSGGGNDLIYLTGGTDHVDGGAGHDTVDYSESTLGVRTSLATTAVQTVNTQSHETLLSIENLTGSEHNDVLTGNAGANILRGNGGNDTLKGSGGRDTLSGGAGHDVIDGGSGSDHLAGGAGADRFVYSSAADSTGSHYDVIRGFDGYSDSFDVPGVITGIDAAVNHGALSSTSFDANLSADLNASHLAAHHAVEFTPNSGSLAGDHFLVVDANGVAGYQAGADLVIELSAPSSLHITTGDFI